MSEKENNARFDVRPPPFPADFRSATPNSTSESDFFNQLAAQRSPRRKPNKSTSVRQVKPSLIATLPEDSRLLQSEYKLTRKIDLSLKPETIKQLADSGNADAMLAYGNLIMESNPKKGLKYIKQAANSNNAEAACKYSVMLMSHIDKHTDLSEAIKYLEKSAILGDPQGQYEYGRLLIHGKQVPKDTHKGAEFIQKSADQDYSPAQFRYSRILMRSNASEEEIKDGVRYLKLAAHNKNPESMVRLAQLYEKGNYVKQNYGKSVNLFREASELGNTEAMNCFGTILLNGECGVDANPKEAIRILEKAAAKNNSDAIFNIGQYLATNGNNLEKQKGLDYIKRAASLGNHYAQYNIGLMYEKGENFTKDLKEAAKYYELSSKKGNVKAICNLASMLASGDGIEKDEKRALELFKQAADQGHVISMYRYANMLEKAGSMALYRGQITDYYTMAANRGHPRSMLCAAKLIEGNDRNLAKELYEKAAKSGIDEALYRLAILQKLDGEETYKNTMKEAADKGVVDAQVQIALDTIKNGTPEEKEKALETFKKASETGHPVAKYNYGIALLDSNKREAVRLIAESADQQYVQAQYEYGRILRKEGAHLKAFKYLSLAADGGNADAQYLVAMMYELGEGCQRSSRNSFPLIESAAKGGNADAQYRYSMMLEEGINCLKSHSDSVKFLKLSAEGGNKEAILKYTKILLSKNNIDAFKYAKRGLMIKKPQPELLTIYAKLLRNGFGCEINLTESSQVMKRAADMDYAEARFLYADMILNNECQGTESEAEEYLVRSSDLGYKQARTTLAEYFEMKEDMSKANHFYRLAADSGDSEGCRKYANYLLNNDSNDDKKKREGEIFLRRSSTDHNVEAEFQVANLPGVAGTFDAKQLLKQAAYAGHVGALTQLSYTSNNPIKLLESSSSSGDAKSLYLLGKQFAKTQPIRATSYLLAALSKGEYSAYITLSSLTDDENLKEEYLKKALENDVEGSEGALGVFYEKTDKEKAISYYRKGSDKGDAESMYRLAMILIDEDKDSKEGHSLLIRAANKNHIEAKIELAKDMERIGEKTDALKLYQNIFKQTGNQTIANTITDLIKSIGNVDNGKDSLRLMFTKQQI
ncbi:hypothetical protein TVAG_008700 [Trichomonas vaginalis G3]|uniref:Sel1 repeat family protein n=1 Tax=Trichomonas vaginalis (strain ATCC PRA-98 / G3) TaxID=412133 RepID=A2F7U3_TRIV3|nr:SEL-1-like protein family [Trichomonas vaginalis G3]EAX99022.1 hypothetical protein TVAG_008700 [Trichomonas vaginalis G3]KAI5539496.1 SEL-1-like protein family [Trichomonas vaginalis G3]|eukprot:XP_001311952.1 hypothetical protein [Trichomonas vaginalis G3]